MNKGKFSRRDFLKLAGATSAGLALSACGVKATEIPTATNIPIPPTDTPAPTITPTPNPTTTATATPIPNTLRGYAKALGIKLGAVVEGVGEDPVRSKLLAEQFNQIAVTTIDWSVIRQDGRYKYDFHIPDGFIRKFAPENKLSIMGMHLVYGDSNTPEWLVNGNFSRNELIEIMKEHVTKVVSRYRGKVRAYTVINEATEPSIFWNRHVGPEYVEIALKTAREADPSAILIYNDYAHEISSLPKAKRVFNAVKALKEKNLLDAVGMQMHMLGGENIDPRNPPTKDELLEQIYRYGELGLNVFITELDVDISKLSGTLDEKLAKQAEIYGTVVEACLESSGVCSDINIWGVNDVETWSGEAGLLFSNNSPKPAYFAVLDVLKKFYEAKQ